MFNYRACLTILLMADLSVAWGADVYRCPAPDGSTVYSDTPCNSDAKVQQINPQPRISGSGSAGLPTAQSPPQAQSPRIRRA
jgi:hypothetical protein